MTVLFYNNLQYVGKIKYQFHQHKKNRRNKCHKNIIRLGNIPFNLSSKEKFVSIMIKEKENEEKTIISGD